ncbi:MAG: N-acetylmuramoyl-L-alanine amidase [Pseudomonadota bacterium]|nr:MAG: N-acetylmuramoyl-L-alanine amidase [Pseudomonadota bacterium]
MKRIGIDAGGTGEAVVRRRAARLLALCLGALCLVLAEPVKAQDPAPAPAGAAVAVAAEVKPDGATTRLSLTISRPVEARAFLLERPDRVIIDLPEVNFQLPANAGRKGAGLVASYRFGLFAPGRSRIVIDLAQPALVESIENRTLGEATLLVIELSRTDRATYHRMALKPMVEPEPLPAAAMSQPAGTTDDKPLVVIDPGHGGVDPGAIGVNGVAEKDVVFAFAERLRQRLEETGRYRVMLTRTSDTFVSLAGRWRMAQKAGASLFISIHADTLSDGSRVRGATVYTGSGFASDAESERLAAKENLADQIAGLDVVEDPNEIAGILADLTKRETRVFSLDFAQKVVDSLRDVVTLNKNPLRSAGFIVLKAPDIPSVLIELGYLSSAKDVDLMTSDAWRDKSSAALVKAVDSFFATRLAAQPGAAVSP